MSIDRHREQRHSYDIQALDAGTELPRLEQQVELVRELEQPYLDRMDISPDATVVDLGCGPGFMSRVLARMVPRGRVIGVDVDPELLDQARSSFAVHGLGNGAFLLGWAHEIPLRDGEADLVYARFLLQHLSNPVEVLREVRRVGRPGGWVLILDTDDGALLVHPEPEGLPRLLEASRRSQAMVGGDRHVGRKLREHMLAAGLEHVRVEMTPFSSEMVGMQAFIDICLGYKRQIIAAELMPPEEVEAVLQELSSLDEEKGAFAQTLGYMAYGRFPARPQ